MTFQAAPNYTARPEFSDFSAELDFPYITGSYTIRRPLTGAGRPAPAAENLPDSVSFELTRPLVFPKRSSGRIEPLVASRKSPCVPHPKRLEVRAMPDAHGPALLR